MKKKKQRKRNVRILSTLMAMILVIISPCPKSYAAEVWNDEIPSIEVTTTNKVEEYGSWGVQPITTMYNCEIIMAFTLDGLEMDFTTSCVDIASVIGVKDIKVQQKMWYGWKTVLTSPGAENQNEDLFCASLTYPDAVNGKTYRVTCVHYANYDVYEEVENDTGAFKFVL